MNQPNRKCFTCIQISYTNLVILISALVVIISYINAFEYIRSFGSKGIWLNFKTVASNIESIRTAEVEWIRAQVSRSPEKKSIGSFAMVRGPQGMGKSVAIEWAVRNMTGVVKIPSVLPGKDQDDIIESVVYQLSGLRGNWEENQASINRLLGWYYWYQDLINAKKRAPIIIIPASQRAPYQNPAELTAAARILVEEFQLNVIIDCSENACPEKLTVRENILDVEPMTIEMMRQLPTYNDLFEILRNQGNEEIVLEVCGGSPLLIGKLHERLISVQDKKLQQDIVKKFILNLLTISKAKIKEFIKVYPKSVVILNMFKEKSAIEHDIVIDQLYETKLPDFKDVLRKVMRSSDEESIHYVPANGAVRVILRHGVEKKYDFESIKNDILSWPEHKD